MNENRTNKYQLKWLNHRNSSPSTNMFQSGIDPLHCYTALSHHSSAPSESNTHQISDHIHKINGGNMVGRFSESNGIDKRVNFGHFSWKLSDSSWFSVSLILSITKVNRKYLKNLIRDLNISLKIHACVHSHCSDRQFYWKRGS